MYFLAERLEKGSEGRLFTERIRARIRAQGSKPAR